MADNTAQTQNGTDNRRNKTDKKQKNSARTRSTTTECNRKAEQHRTEHSERECKQRGGFYRREWQKEHRRGTRNRKKKKRWTREKRGHKRSKREKQAKEQHQNENRNSHCLSLFLLPLTSFPCSRAQSDFLPCIHAQSDPLPCLHAYGARNSMRKGNRSGVCKYEKQNSLLDKREERREKKRHTHTHTHLSKYIE